MTTMTCLFSEMYQAVFIINGQEYVKSIDSKNDVDAEKQFMRLWSKRRPAFGHCQGWLMREWNECIRQVHHTSSEWG